jgi:antitoxin HicB
MASPGGEGLIGWHVNRGGTEAAVFFPADRFREQFNRPDVVNLVLGLQDEEAAIAEANKRAGVKRADEAIRAALPPVIEILRPENDATFRQQEVTLEYQARSPTGNRITDIDVRINGAALGARAFIPETPRSEEPIRLTLSLPAEDVTVTLVAREGDRASHPASVQLRWDGVKPGDVARQRLRGRFVGTCFPDKNVRYCGMQKRDRFIAELRKAAKTAVSASGRALARQRRPRHGVGRRQGDHGAGARDRSQDSEQDQEGLGPSVRMAMKSFVFHALFEPGAKRGVAVSFPDVPEAVTQGADSSDAYAMAEEALGLALLTYPLRGLPLPKARARGGELVPVAVAADVAAKVAVLEAFGEAGITKVELGRRLGKDEKEVRRILDPRHPTKLPTLTEALRALGRRLVVAVEKAATA